MRECDQLMMDFNTYWFMTAHIEAKRRAGGYLSSLKATPERLELLEEMAQWCREHGLDPRLWLFCLFRVRKWQFAPRLQPGHLMSERMIERYQKLRGLDGYRTKLQEERTEADRQAGKNYDPNRDTDPTIESMKAHYVQSGQTDRCMREMVDQTLGFHPRSSVCTGCPSQIDCLRRLEAFVDFDIMALRLGQISAEQAMMKVRHARRV